MALRSSVLSGRTSVATRPAYSSQMLLEKLRRPAPSQLRRLAIVHRLPLLVDEGMLGLIPKQLERLAGGFHCLLEAIDDLRRAPVVLAGEMGLKRNFHVRRLCRLL